VPNPHWRTPKALCDLIAQVGEGGRVRVDPFAGKPHHRTHVNAQIKLYSDFRKPQGGGGMAADWKQVARGGLVFCNPDYSRDALGDQMAKILAEANAGTHIIALVPSSTDTAWFQRAMATCDQVCFLKGRVRFEGHTEAAERRRQSGKKSPPLFSSAVFHFAGVGDLVGTGSQHPFPRPAMARTGAPRDRITRFDTSFAPRGLVVDRRGVRSDTEVWREAVRDSLTISESGASITHIGPLNGARGGAASVVSRSLVEATRRHAVRSGGQ
jgi:hypothetical protein